MLKFAAIIIVELYTTLILKTKLQYPVFHSASPLTKHMRVGYR